MNSLEALCSIKFSMHHRCKPKYVYEVEKDNFDLIRNDLEVLKLIKEKNVDIEIAKYLIQEEKFTPHSYNYNFDEHFSGWKHLNQEEIDKIKDWLGRN